MDLHFYRDASGRLTFEIFRVSAEEYFAVRDAVVISFGLVPEGTPVTDGIDLVFQVFRRGDQVVELAWENWTGFTVGARTTASEVLVREVAAWLTKSRWATKQTRPNG